MHCWRSSKTRFQFTISIIKLLSLFRLMYYYYFFPAICCGWPSQTLCNQNGGFCVENVNNPKIVAHKKHYRCEIVVRSIIRKVLVFYEMFDSGEANRMLFWVESLWNWVLSGTKTWFSSPLTGYILLIKLMPYIWNIPARLYYYQLLYWLSVCINELIIRHWNLVAWNIWKCCAMHLPRTP